MSLRLYNTLTRQKQLFEPIDRSNVRLYACGPTVYDHLHIGNGRMLIVFDVLFRVLRHIYGADHVTYVRNITDVDDKINARAAERGVDIRVLTNEMTEIFHEDAAALGCLPPTVEPRATEHITEMIAIIERLIAKGHAYAAEGHVLFDVPSMPDYGKLSKRPLDDMIAGARVEVAPYKRGPMDFVLWKPSRPDEPGWESPWGRGRPGWHIECSAMSWRYLGEIFDIHGGGIDLVFPHHENEVAQTCSAFGHQVMANIWMHNGHLQVEGEKMSKSLGNFVTIRELLGKYSGAVIRFNMLKTHYRQPIDWRSDELQRSRTEMHSFAKIITDMASEKKYQEPDWSLADEELLAALDDDLNTPLALARLRQLAELGKRNYSDAGVFAVNAALLGLQNLDRPPVFSDGFVSSIPDEKLDQYISVRDDLIRFKNFSSNNLRTSASECLSLIRAQGFDAEVDIGNGGSAVDRGRLTISVRDSFEEPTEQRIERLIAARIDARKNKNWAESDRLREKLDAMGIALKDNKDGTTSWEPKR
ncbi:cysteine--tRNA ligase [Methylocapsa polymorpha]|uniref:Cysteine--tRNA ligase n=1 Tax=Methylocapsa polymorpha TaxID=3080828 RepID=A0ABZ0HQU4_9HYPH|nr:cysteine--tRNA ligase [Methylocapsa sp. RX1]